MTVALISAADASVTRTFISAQGNDANTSMNCSVTSPCRTFATALTVTQAGGEIVAMTPGGFGPITITGPLSVIGVDGATITAATGTVGITVSAGATDKIYIRNLTVTGGNASNSTGMQVNSGQVVVESVSFKLLTTGVLVGNNSSTAHADLIKVTVVGTTTAVETNGAGVPWNSGGGFYNTSSCPCSTLVRIFGGSYVDNTTAFVENNPTAASGVPSATIWAVNASFYAAGYTTLETSMGTGGVSGQPQSPETSTPFPN